MAFELEQHKISVAQHGHFTERMDCEDFGSAEPRLGQHIVDALLLAGHADNPRVGRTQ